MCIKVTSLGSNPDSTMDWLYDLGQLFLLLMLGFLTYKMG